MPKQENLPTVPLKEEEREHLLVIYYTRLRFFTIVFSLLIAFGLINSFRVLGVRPDDGYDFEVFGHELTRTELFLFAVTFCTMIFIIPGIRIFKKRILAFKQDADSGKKEVVNYTITDKKYFDRTQQFYFSFDDPNYMHYEVTADVFMSYQVGDTVPVYRGVRSKYVFEKDGRFSFM